MKSHFQKILWCVDIFFKKQSVIFRKEKELFSTSRKGENKKVEKKEKS